MVTGFFMGGFERVHKIFLPKHFQIASNSLKVGRADNPTIYSEGATNSERAVFPFSIL